MSEEIQGIENLMRRLGEMAIDIRHVEKPLRAAGAYVVGSVQKNFQQQGRPERWTPLAPVTLARRRKGRGKGGPQILIDTARLKNSIGYKLVTGPAVTVGTNTKYAARQHFGYPGVFSGGRSKSKGKIAGWQRGRTHTPARPFLMIQREDLRPIEEIFMRHMTRG